MSLVTAMRKYFLADKISHLTEITTKYQKKKINNVLLTYASEKEYIINNIPQNIPKIKRYPRANQMEQ